MACSSCKVHLQVEDGHDLCPACLGIGHLREALTDPCMNCSTLPLSVREARLLEVENLMFRGDLPPSGVPSGGKEKRKRVSKHGGRGHPARKRSAATGMAPGRQEMDDLRAEVERLKAMVQPLPPRPPTPPPPQADWELEEDNADAMSTRASDSMFQDGVYSPRYDPSPERGSQGAYQPESVQAEDGSETSRRSSGSTEPGDGPCALRATLRAALAKVGLDEPPAAQVVTNPFFRRVATAPPFTVPPSPHFLDQLKQCWADPGAPAHRGRDARALASMGEAEKHGLVHMPPVDQCIAALVLPPDEALKNTARCPSSQCRVTDGLLSKAYDSAACMARLGNSLSVLLLAQSKILESGQPGRELGDMNDVALETFGLMSSELGRLMSTLVVARRQVWLAQAPMSDECRKALRKLPVVPGQLFGPEADRALERRQQSRQASEAWGQRGRGMMAPPARPSKPRGARDPRRSGYLNPQPQPQPWQRDQPAASRWQHQPRGERRQPRQPQRGQWRNQRPPKPPNNPPGTA